MAAATPSAESGSTSETGDTEAFHELLVRSDLFPDASAADPPPFRALLTLAPPPAKGALYADVWRAVQEWAYTERVALTHACATFAFLLDTTLQEGCMGADVTLVRRLHGALATVDDPRVEEVAAVSPRRRLLQGALLTRRPGEEDDVGQAELVRHLDALPPEAQAHLVAWVWEAPARWPRSRAWKAAAADDGGFPVLAIASLPGRSHMGPFADTYTELEASTIAPLPAEEAVACLRALLEECAFVAHQTYTAAAAATRTRRAEQPWAVWNTPGAPLASVGGAALTTTGELLPAAFMRRLRQLPGATLAVWLRSFSSGSKKDRRGGGVTVAHARYGRRFAFATVGRPLGPRAPRASPRPRAGQSGSGPRKSAGTGRLQRSASSQPAAPSGPSSPAPAPSPRRQAPPPRPGRRTSRQTPSA